MSGEEPAALLAELKALAEENQDQHLRATMLAAPAVAAAMSGQADEAIEPLREATRLADETEDAGLKLALRAVLVIALFFSGRLREALAITEEALARAPAVPELGTDIFGFSPFIMLLMFRAQLLRHTGHLEEAGARARSRHGAGAGAWPARDTGRDASSLCRSGMAHRRRSPRHGARAPSGRGCRGARQRVFAFAGLWGAGSGAPPQ